MFEKAILTASDTCYYFFLSSYHEGMFLEICCHGDKMRI